MKASAVVAIDPGPEFSALVIWDGKKIREPRYAPNIDDLWAALAVAITWWDQHPEVQIDREQAFAEVVNA